MKSDYPIVQLKNYVQQVSQRNKDDNKIEVFSVTNSEGFTKSSEYFNKKVFSKDTSNYKIVSHGEFAYNPSRINVGSIDFLKDEENVLVSPLYIVFKTTNKLHANYLLLYMKSDWGNLQIRSNTEGAVRDSLKFSGLEQIKIPLPSLEDQIRIANLLSKVSGLIAQRKENLRQLDELLKSFFLEMFGDPVRNEKEWDKPELKKFGKISTGNTPPRKDASSYSSRYLEWIKTDNIPSDSVYISQATEYLSESGSKKGRIITEGALLIACIAGSVESIGRASLTNRTVSFNQQINAIQPSKDVNPFFLYVLFKMTKPYIQSHATKGMKKILTKGDFEKIKMIKPPISLQDSFANIVEKIESVKSQYKQNLADLENLYGALSQKAFKGELDLSRLDLTKNDADEVRPVAPVSIEQKPKPVIVLPAPAELSDLNTAEVRMEVFAQWLDSYLDQLGGESFSAAHFMELAQQKLAELLEEDPYLNVTEYDYVKQWLFNELDAGRISQQLNIISKPGEEIIYGNQILLTKVP